MISSVRFAAPAGRTVRIAGAPGWQLVLVVGEDPTSTAWFRTVSSWGHPAMRLFLTICDLRQMTSRLHVVPTSVPAFLVCVNGWPVDWFPLPNDVQPAYLADVVRVRLPAYTAATPQV